MNYIFHYDIAAILICIIVGGLFFSKKHIPSQSNRLFLCIGALIITASLFDVISVYSLNHIEVFPMWLNYIINQIYFFSFNCTYVIYFIYLLLITERHKGRYGKIMKKINTVVLIFITVAIAITPWAKTIFYFENNEYKHGFLHTILYAVAFIMLAGCIFTVLTSRRKINNMHLITTCTIAIISIVAIMIQLIWNELLLVNFVASLLFFMLFHSLQNPDDYLDKELDIFNIKAFLREITKRADKKKEFTVLAFEIEGLQFVDQLMGVESSNELLATVVKDCTKGLKGDMYHLEGPRFAYIFDKNSKDAEEHADWLKWRFVTAFHVNRVAVNLTMRMCTVDFPEVAESSEEILNAISSGLDEAKEENSYDVVVTTRESTEKHQRSAIISHILKSAVRNKSFEVYFQPIYSIDDKAFSAAEALVRLRDEELGFIPPDEFIPIAEQNGLILEVGDIVFHKVCEFLQSADAKDLGIRYVEVNLSMVQCLQEDLHKHLKSIMDRYGIPYNMIDFEVTETFSAVDNKILVNNMDRLIDSGCTFAVDDYGTGYSNTDYLIELPFELVKLDKSVVWAATDNEKAMKVLEHTAAMIKSLGLKIVAEGVETFEQALMLRSVGCDFLQGYYFSKPIPPAEYVEFMRNAEQCIKEKLTDRLAMLS
ncbi:MAG: EAL domain-containing protein [Lachnospiraceae bacterium]|nr:EAL domain-containing protein [Lachnospiraceae bacterium]